jgi:hypothetical protein
VPADSDVVLTEAAGGGRPVVLTGKLTSVVWLLEGVRGDPATSGDGMGGEGLGRVDAGGVVPGLMAGTSAGEGVWG